MRLSLRPKRDRGLGRVLAAIVAAVTLASGVTLTPAEHAQARNPDSAPPPAPQSAARSAAHPLRGPRDATPACEHAQDRLLVRYKPGLAEHERRGAAASIRGQSMRRVQLVPGLEVVSTTLPLDTAAATLRSRPGVLAVELDCRVELARTPNDPAFASQWGLHNTGQTGGTSGADIRAPAAWDVITDASAVTVAVLDTGMQLNHPDLAANLWTNPGEIAGNGKDDDGNGYVDDVRGWDFVNQDADPSDDHGHGTHVAGIIGARGDNGTGIAGVAWAVKLMPLKVLDADGRGYVSAIVAGLDYAVAKGARVSNHSHGTYEFSRSLYDAFVAAGNAGQLMVAAAGNSSLNADEYPHYPSSFRLERLVSVIASTHRDEIASFSNYGLVNAHLAAPGQSIYSTLRGSSYGTMSGTSMAAPFVTGVAALVAARNPTWNAGQLRDRILGTTRPVAALADRAWTGGVVDAAAAVGTGSTTLPPSLPVPEPQTLAAAIVTNPAPSPISAPAPPSFPATQAIDSRLADLGPPAIALDGTGKPYVAYAKTHRGVYLSSLQSGSWSERQLSNVYDDFYWLDLAVDGAGVPTVAVQRQWSRSDRYWDPGIVFLRGAQPPTETRLTAACPRGDTCFEDWAPVVAYDSAGAAHVAFTRHDPSPWTDDRVLPPSGSGPTAEGVGLYYATNSGGQWTVRRLTSNAGDELALIDAAADGSAHVVFRRRDGWRTGLYHATNESGAWIARRLTDRAEDLFSAADVDGTGGIHVAFARTGLGVFYLQRPAGGGWSAPVQVDSASAWSVDLAVEANGKAHVAFGTVDALNTVNGVRYATNRSGGWVTATVATNEGAYPSIAVDGAGRAHIAYLNAWLPADAGVYYATNASGSFQRTLVRADSEIEDFGTFAHVVDSGGFSHVALAYAFGEKAAGLYYGTNRSGSWTLSRVYAGFPSAVALAVDGNARAHIAYTEHFDAQNGVVLPTSLRKAGYLTNASGSWQNERVSPGGDVGQAGVAITLDGSGKRHVFFADSSQARLLRGRRESTGWQIDQLYSGANVRQPSAASDTGGSLHVAIAARVGSQPGLGIVHLRGGTTGGSWTSTALTNGQQYDLAPAVAAASDGSIWISRWRWESGIWVHRRTAAGAWSSTQLSGNVHDILPTIATGPGGRVHVVYRRAVFYGGSGCTVPQCAAGPGLRHAQLVDGAWQTSKLTPNWYDTLPIVAANPGGTVRLVFAQQALGLRALTLAVAPPPPPLPPDVTAPVVQVPTRALVAPQVLGTTARLRLSWPAASDPSGITRYELQSKKGTGSWVAVALPSPTALSAEAAVVPGANYTFRLRARDGAGNVGQWATTTTARVALLQENAIAVSYVGKFKRVALSGASGGYVRKTAVAGRVARLSFSGTSVAFVSTLGPGRGIAQVWLDGKHVATLDLYSPTVKKKQVVWAANVAAGSHTLEIRVTGTKRPAATGTRVDIDAFMVHP